jgi:uncharacterized protein
MNSTETYLRRRVDDRLDELLRSSSPKLQVLNSALMSAQTGYTFDEARLDPEYWGRLVESAVGAHLANAWLAGHIELFYWRDRNREVDFVVKTHACCRPSK